MQVFQSEDDVGQVEPCNIRGEPLSPAKMREKLPAGNIGHEHVDVQAVLESREEIYNKRMPNPRQDVTLSVDVFDLTEANDFSFPENLHSKNILGSRSR